MTENVSVVANPGIKIPTLLGSVPKLNGFILGQCYTTPPRFIKTGPEVFKILLTDTVTNKQHWKNTTCLVEVRSD